MPSTEAEALLYRIVGERIRARRKGRLKQRELAAIVGLSRASVANIELGRQRIPLHVLLRLSDALGCEPIDLIPARQQVGLAADAVAPGQIVIKGNLTPQLRTLLYRFTTAGGINDESSKGRSPGASDSAEAPSD